MSNFINWVWYSSKDPQKVSLFIKGLGLAAIPTVLQISGLVCSIGSVCVDFDRSVLEGFVEAVAQLVYYITAAISAWAIVWGFLRKLTSKN